MLRLESERPSEILNVTVHLYGIGPDLEPSHDPERWKHATGPFIPKRVLEAHETLVFLAEPGAIDFLRPGALLQCWRSMRNDCVPVRWSEIIRLSASSAPGRVWIVERALKGSSAIPHDNECDWHLVGFDDVDR